MGTPPAIGVGPWEGAWPQLSDGGLDPAYDARLLTEGDRRNVADEFRYRTHESIVAELDTRRHDLHIAVENWEHDFNIGSVIRTANAFNVAAFHIIGKRRWNRRGAMVTDRYQHEHHHASVEDFVGWAHATGLRIVAVDNIAGSRAIETRELPRRCVMVFGQEGPGISPELLAAADETVHITQFGSTRSMNAGAAAAIAMHAWVRRHVFDQSPST